MAGIARLHVRSGKWKASPVTTRLVINRVFEAAIAALIIGVASPAVGPVLDRWLNGDQTYRGSWSDSGDPVPNASVNLITVRTATTNAEGLFEIIVPRNRLLKEYKFRSRRQGMKPRLFSKASEETIIVFGGWWSVDCAKGLCNEAKHWMDSIGGSPRAIQCEAIADYTFFCRY